MHTLDKFKWMLAASVMLAVSSIAHAQDVENDGSALAAPAPSPALRNTVKPSPSPTPKKWGAELNTKYQFSLHTASDANKQSSVTSSLGVSYYANPNLRILTQLGINQGIQPAVDFRLYNPEIRAFFGLSNPKNKLKFSLGPTLTLPLGTDASDESLNLGLGLGGRILFDLRDENQLGFRAYYDLVFGKNFHKYETSIFAEVNTQYSLNHVVYAEYNATSEWSFNATFAFTTNWSYFNVMSNNYSIEQEVDYSISDLVYLYLSHVRGGDFLSANGQNYSFGLFNKDASRMSLGVVLSI